MSVEPLTCAYWNLPYRNNCYAIRASDELHEVMLGAVDLVGALHAAFPLA